MRAIQTLWTGDKNLLQDSFGWIHSQYNLMSWALSCLTLKEHYEDVILYTDSNGYTIFHDYLKLPYKEIIVKYDNLNCHKDLWAYPKLLTYSLQNKPFIHVDGDVYLSQKLSKKIESGELITQNAEVGTSYYKNMIDGIMKQNFSIPNVLLGEMKKDSISSYNAGVLGGNDLKFIKEYCQIAFEFIDNNRLRDINNSTSNTACNILFEQILFHCLAEAGNKEVSTVINHSVKDNGYSYNEFCDFYSFDAKNLMHIIGRHKQNKRVCELLSRTLLKKYPQYYEKIIKLFPTEHKRLGNSTKTILRPFSKIQENVHQYESFLSKELNKWNKITNSKLLEQEQKSSNYFHFLGNTVKNQSKTVINRNPYLSIYETKGWDEDTYNFMRSRFSERYVYDHFDIACIPSLLGDGYKEYIINDLCYNVLMLLHEPQTFGFLLKAIKKYLPNDVQRSQRFIRNLLLQTLEYLFFNKLIYIEHQ